jgi:hypothetical protein
MPTSMDSPQLPGPLDYPRSCSLTFFYFPEFLPISYEFWVVRRADAPGTVKQSLALQSLTNCVPRLHVIVFSLDLKTQRGETRT